MTGWFLSNDQLVCLRFDGWLPLLVGVLMLAEPLYTFALEYLGWHNNSSPVDPSVQLAGRQLHVRLTAAVYCIVVAMLRARRQWQLHARAAFDTQNPELRHVHTATAQPLSWSLAFLEFPLVFDLATEFGFLATFAVPSISAILVGSGNFGTAPQKRESTARYHVVGESCVVHERIHTDCAMPNERRIRRHQYHHARDS
eukprot:COSAG02_NODE_20285_length_839_cov_1.667568_1_plen_198_part_10